MHCGNEKKPNKKRQKTLKTRKSLAQEDDSEDEFKPKKVTKQTKRPPVQATEDNPKPTQAPQARVAKVEESDDDTKVIVPPPKKTIIKSMKPKSDVESSPVQRDKGKGKAAPKRKR